MNTTHEVTGFAALRAAMKSGEIRQATFGPQVLFRFDGAESTHLTAKLLKWNKNSPEFLRRLELHLLSLAQEIGPDLETLVPPRGVTPAAMSPGADLKMVKATLKRLKRLRADIEGMGPFGQSYFLPVPLADGNYAGIFELVDMLRDQAETAVVELPKTFRLNADIRRQTVARLKLRFAGSVANDYAEIGGTITVDEKKPFPRILQYCFAGIGLADENESPRRVIRKLIQAQSAG